LYKLLLLLHFCFEPHPCLLQNLVHRTTTIKDCDDKATFHVSVVPAWIGDLFSGGIVVVAAETILDFAFASYCVLDTKLVRQNSH
jgi:hypothetical protein